MGDTKDRIYVDENENMLVQEVKRGGISEVKAKREEIKITSGSFCLRRASKQYIDCDRKKDKNIDSDRVHKFEGRCM